VTPAVNPAPVFYYTNYGMPTQYHVATEVNKDIAPSSSFLQNYQYGGPVNTPVEVSKEVETFPPTGVAPYVGSFYVPPQYYQPVCPNSAVKKETKKNLKILL